MSRRAAMSVELPIAVVVAVLAVWCWFSSMRTSSFGPAVDGAPATVGTSYDGSLVALASLLVTIAAVLTVDVVRRWRSV